MNWLRLILLVGGLLFIGALIWLERRRPSRVQPQGEFRAERSEPAFGPPDEDSARAHTAEIADLAPRGPDPGRAPPLIDWSKPVAGDSEDPPLIRVGDVSAVRVLAREQAPPDEIAQPVRVEWPPESQRQIVSLRIVAARQNRIAGRALRQGLSGAGFQHGNLGIFHLAHNDGRVLLSAASLVRPGVLDPTAMDFQSFSGINLFAVLPGPLSTEQTLERLTSVATELAQRVEGRVQDERGMPFDSAHPAVWRERALGHIGEHGADAAADTGPAD
jgi:hypothetical protein